MADSREQKQEYHEANRFDWRRIVFGDESLPDPDWPTDHVPPDARRSFVGVTAVLLGLVFFAGTLFAGAEVGAALGFGPMLTALAVGSVILGIYVYTLCYRGANRTYHRIALAVHVRSSGREVG